MLYNALRSSTLQPFARTVQRAPALRVAARVKVERRSSRNVTTVADTVLKQGAGSHVTAKSDNGSAVNFAPEDGKAAFAGSSTLSLFCSYSLLELCRWRLLINIGTRIMAPATDPRSGVLGDMLLKVAKPAFVHFCAGERLEDCMAASKKLAESARVTCIVDWSVEEREDASAWDENCDRKAETIRIASEALGRNAAFVPVKLTALLSPALLERLAVLPAAGHGLDALEHDLRSALSSEDCTLLDLSLERLRKLCRVARDCNMPLLLDAEQSNRQPAVHVLARILQREFNVDGKAVVYDTVQMYLRSAPQRLEANLASAQAGHYTFAVKLVRGAYIEQEGPLGTVCDSKVETDNQYDKSAARLLSAISNSETATADGPKVALLLATHNRKSLERATSEMARLGLRRDHPNVHFAQILGMVDNLTNALGVGGYNAAKLVVFGNMREVLPWLLRRVQENRDAFGAQSLELPVMRSELRRRLLAWGASS